MWYNAKSHLCIDCACCDKDNLKCYPNDPDCMSEYDLDENDLYTEKPCDLFKPLRD